jgi:hypothetical protein
VKKPVMATTEQLATGYYLRRFHYLAGTQAPGAHLDIADGTLAQGPDLPKIGLPAALGVVIGMADVVPYRRAFAADVTDIGHVASSSNLLIL